MVNVVQHNPNVLTNRALLFLLGIMAVTTVVSTIALTSITHNFYVSSYYTISAIFDAVGVDQSATLSSLAGTPYEFDVVVAVSLIDGVVKIVLVGFVLAAVINLITTFDIRSRLSHITARGLRDHIILCGYSLLAERLAFDLMERKVPFVVIEREKAKADLIREAGFVSFHDDFTSDAVLKSASIKTARAIMFLTTNDYENLLGVITARHTNDKIKIIARANENATVTKIHRAGAELCVVPEVLAGLEMGDYLTTKGLKR